MDKRKQRVKDTYTQLFEVETQSREVSERRDGRTVGDDESYRTR